MSKVAIGKRVAFEYGYAVRVNDEPAGQYPIYGSNGAIGYIDSYKVKGPGVIIGRKGSVGKITYSEQHFTPTDTAYYLRLLDSDKDDMRFWSYFLPIIGLEKLNTHSAVPGLSREIAYLLETEIPEKNDQVKIARVLAMLDTKIGLNNRINSELEAIAKTLYQYWFVQFDFPFDFSQGKPDANGKPYKSSGGKMVYNSILKREIPEGWEANPLSKHLSCNINKLGKKHNLKKICYLDTANMTRNVIDSFQNFICEEDNIPSRANMIVSKNDILYSTVRPNQYHYGIIKQPAENMIASTGFSVLSHKSNNLLNVVFYLCITNDTNTQKLIKISESSKSSYPSISPNDILNLVIAMPKNSEIVDKASNILNPIFDKVAEVQRETKELAALRDWLLPMLMNDQVTVNNEFHVSAAADL